MKGDLKIDTAGPGDTKAKLVGAFSGNFNPATGFASGSIGTGGNGAVLSNPSPCTKATSKP